MNEMFIPDPENLNQQEEEELTYLLQESMHNFVLGPNGKCSEPTRKFCYEHNRIDYHNPCNASESSVLHYYEPECSCSDYRFCGNPNHA